MMIGTPMGAAGFDTLARHFTDRTVVTYDQRGVEGAVHQTYHQSGWGHGGFLGVEYGQQSIPGAFAARLRVVLEGDAPGPTDVV